MARISDEPRGSKDGSIYSISLWWLNNQIFYPIRDVKTGEYPRQNQEDRISESVGKWQVFDTYRCPATIHSAIFGCTTLPGAVDPYLKGASGWGVLLKFPPDGRTKYTDCVS